MHVFIIFNGLKHQLGKFCSIGPKCVLRQYVCQTNGAVPNNFNPNQVSPVFLIVRMPEPEVDAAVQVGRDSAPAGHQLVVVMELEAER